MKALKTLITARDNGILSEMHDRYCIECGKLLKSPLRKKVKRCYSCSKKAQLNPQWKGIKVKYFALHEWIANHKPKQNFCNSCKKNNSRLELANISRKYKRDINDFEWLCHKCHMNKDGIIERLKNQPRINGRFVSYSSTIKLNSGVEITNPSLSRI